MMPLGWVVGRVAQLGTAQQHNTAASTPVTALEAVKAVGWQAGSLVWLVWLGVAWQKFVEKKNKFM